MKARMPAGFGRPDMNALMRQAQKMQDDMKAKQAELEAAEYTGSASGEMVTVRMNGKHEILGITIKPEAVDPDDIEMLEDLVAAAVNATVKQGYFKVCFKFIVPVLLAFILFCQLTDFFGLNIPGL